MKQDTIVNGCIHRCPFYGSDMDGMYCGHPYWKDKGAYDNMIITHKNGRDGNVPEECPLRKEDLTITYKLKNDGEA